MRLGSEIVRPGAGFGRAVRKSLHENRNATRRVPRRHEEAGVTDARPSDRRLALVLGGGGSKGALQAGLYLAMERLGVRPDLVVGASVGAVNGAFIAAGVDARTLARGWCGLARTDLFGFHWPLLWEWGRASSLLSARPLATLLESRLVARRFEDLEIPLALVTTHLTAGESCVWERGDLVRAVLASSAIPGLLPPVRGHDGVLHVDGSLTDNVPLELAEERGATHVISMNPRACDRCDRPARSLVDILGHAFAVASDCKLRNLRRDVVADERHLLLQPQLGEYVRAMDFSHGRRLVREGYRYALPRLRAWMERGDPEG